MRINPFAPTPPSETRLERRARYFAQGHTDDGQPLRDPAYIRWLTRREPVTF